MRQGMDAVKLVLAEGARAQVNTAAVCAATLRDVFFECFTTFAFAIDKARNALIPSLQVIGQTTLYALPRVVFIADLLSSMHKYAL